MSDDQDAFELAQRLVGAAKRAPPTALERLAGGKNNRVYRVDLEDGASVALKLYFHDQRDGRDRLNAEWSFLSHAWARGVRVIPEPLAQARDAHAGLYSFLPGRKLELGEPNAAHVSATLDFIIAANAAPRALADLPAGSEACFSLADHIARIDKRVQRLDSISDDAPHAEAARTLVRQKLNPLWAALRANILATDLGDGRQPLPAAHIIASPSDLGFHNALIDDAGVLRFFDFEYAGRDDPAKLCGDFFCCPEIPTPIGQFSAFVEGLAARLDLGAHFNARAHALLDAYRIKWACIILNDFLPVDEARRAFALPGERPQRCAAQLRKAEAKLAAAGA